MQYKDFILDDKLHLLFRVLTKDFDGIDLKNPYHVDCLPGPDTWYDERSIYFSEVLAICENPFSDVLFGVIAEPEKAKDIDEKRYQEFIQSLKDRFERQKHKERINFIMSEEYLEVLHILKEAEQFTYLTDSEYCKLLVEHLLEDRTPDEFAE